MTSDEKLELILTELHALRTEVSELRACLSTRPTSQSDDASAHREMVRKAVTAAVGRLLPSFYTAEQIAWAAGLGDDRPTVIAIGKAMDELGFKRGKSRHGRGFVVTKLSPTQNR